MGKTDANPPMPVFRDDYVLQEVGADWLSKAVRQKQFIHIDQSGASCARAASTSARGSASTMVSPTAIDEAVGTEQPGEDPRDHVIFTIDDDVCTRCALRRPVPDGRHHPGQGRAPAPRAIPTPGPMPTATPTACGSGKQRKRRRPRGQVGSGQAEDRREVSELGDTVPGSQAWNSIFRPGSVFRKATRTAPEPVLRDHEQRAVPPPPGEGEAARGQGELHACLGGLSFFLFILLTVTGIFLMFFYRPDSASAWNDIQSLHTSVTFGLLVRNMHRWGAHLMVLSVFLHMARSSTTVPTSRPGVQLGDRRDPAHAHPAALVHRLPAPGTSWPSGRSPWAPT